MSYQSLIDDNVGNEPPSAQWTPVLTAKSGGEAFQPKNGNLTSLSGLAGAANRLPYFTGANALALTALTAVGRDLIGKATVAEVLTYLGLGEGSALPVGVPVPWPSATPPTGWLKCNGAAFSAEEYPELAKAYPTNKLPDLRGEFIRGWDDGRSVDTGRSVMSAQSARVGYIKFDMGIYGIPAGTGSLILSNDILITDHDSNGSSLLLNNSNERAIGEMYVVPADTRPRNIAFNYIVRAA